MLRTDPRGKEEEEPTSGRGHGGCITPRWGQDREGLGCVTTDTGSLGPWGVRHQGKGWMGEARRRKKSAFRGGGWCQGCLGLPCAESQGLALGQQSGHWAPGQRCAEVHGRGAGLAPGLRLLRGAGQGLSWQVCRGMVRRAAPGQQGTQRLGQVPDRPSWMKGRAAWACGHTPRAPVRKAALTTGMCSLLSGLPSRR